MDLLNWHIVNSTEFAAGEKHDNCLYFLSDTKEIYRGNVPFTESVVMYTELPSTGIALNRLYINSTTLEGKIHNGTAWVTVIKPVEDAVNADSVNPVSGKAVAAFVAAEMAKMSTAANSVSSLSWDSAEHLLTVTKGDNSTQDILFDGLGVSLSYAAATGTIQLLDASGNTIGDPVKIDLERFVSSGEYDSDTQSIILYFDAEKTDSVTIPVADLVDTYTAEGSGALNLTVEGSVIKGSIKISTADGNQITADENGLYVAPIDVSGKMDKITDGTEGNVAIIGVGGQLVDSGKSFDDIVASGGSIYVGATMEEALTGITPKKGDVLIIRTQIGTSDKYQRTVSAYDGESWILEDEAYSAENVYFPNDFLITKTFGKYVPDSKTGKVNLPAGSKSVAGLLVDALSEDVNPTITQPSVSVSMSAAKAYEVGTVVTPSYTATLNPGSYEFGPATGITASSWSVKDTDGRELTTNTGSFDAITVTDGISYKLTATATYEAGAMPITALENDYTAGQIAAGSKSGTSGAITGYRNSFYGTLNSQGELTADIIRGLTKSGKSLANNSAFNITIPVGCVRCVIAYPATLRDLTEVIDVNGMNTNIVSAFGTPTQMDIPGAEGYEPIAYKVYVSDFVATTAANTYKVKI